MGVTEKIALVRPTLILNAVMLVRRFRSPLTYSKHLPVRAAPIGATTIDATTDRDRDRKRAETFKCAIEFMKRPRKMAGKFAAVHPNAVLITAALTKMG
jgi:hypothetical protein